jgi:hypothetical protein
MLKCNQSTRFLVSNASLEKAKSESKNDIGDKLFIIHATLTPKLRLSRGNETQIVQIYVSFLKEPFPNPS